MIATLWSVLTWPFRLIGQAGEGVGRLASGLIGFALMVLGFALAAGSYYLLGLVAIVAGLILTLRALG